ncbi:hypothetical protein BCR33DRAFT_721285 [Rhizoclosmatium globosum]|uniref:Uncharacterized protein n=1 Tax=Rhizoclosmatium globosum TaxID=329046 RepID=A0A1Y2BSR0_9FUNG|nr:hypothetical protein BCR33DRAFT_721285 [Rhizoclosmatium globosum]|eukprot:ORY37789.1 hypothetical protein BCR33DRAFT_721285 [Rhizoclosmatium globosum]
MFGDGNLVAEYKKKMKSFGTEKRGRGTKTDEEGTEEKKVEKPAPKKGRKRSLSAAKSIEAEKKDQEEEEEVVEEQDVKVSSKNSKSTDSQRKRAKTKASKTFDSDKPVEEDIPAAAEENQDDLFEGL